MAQYGMVYRADDLEVWLGIFDENRCIKEFNSISDIKGIYDNLDGKFAFVEIEAEGDRQWLKDIRTFSLTHYDQEVSAEGFLAGVEFPGDEADNAFQMMFSDAIPKSNLN